jgi:hypothetical protein
MPRVQDKGIAERVNEARRAVELLFDLPVDSAADAVDGRSGRERDLEVVDMDDARSERERARDGRIACQIDLRSVADVEIRDRAARNGLIKNKFEGLKIKGFHTFYYFV